LKIYKKVKLSDNTTTQIEAVIEPASQTPPEVRVVVEEVPRMEEESNQKNTSLKQGPLVDRRASPHSSTNRNSVIQNPYSEDELDTSSDESRKRSSPQVAYAPLELDSDVESDLSSAGPRSRKRVPSKDYGQTYDEDELALSSKNSVMKRQFPNPDHYEDPRRNHGFKNSGFQDGSSKTSSFEFSKRGQEADAPKQGDFNELGIPVMGPLPEGKSAVVNAKDVKSLIDRYEQNASQETLDGDQLSMKSTEDARSRSEGKIGIPLVAMVPGRSSLRGQSSSGINSSSDAQDKDLPLKGSATPNPMNTAKGDRPTHQTDF